MVSGGVMLATGVEDRLRDHASLVHTGRSNSYVLDRYDAGQLADPIKEDRRRVIAARYFDIDRHSNE